ncbi:transposase [Saccharopolyspora erythraea]|uniref:transposase n=1 Tax=Saccharopolyspora erythraea TaxID=1836 RepID=UPI001BA492B9|nr:transposase [Saccharopolyspora erythraea]QUH01117.1 transposase [Saccharopolyspora erythraea]
MSDKHRNFSPQFKAEAVPLVVTAGRPVAEAARELEINPGTLGSREHAWRRNNPEPEPEMSPVERARLSDWRRFRRAVRRRRERISRAQSTDVAGPTHHRNIAAEAY